MGANDKAARGQQWWGDFKLSDDEWGHWQIGPLEIYASRQPTEWRFEWRVGSDPVDDTVLWEIVESTPGVNEEFNVCRYSFEVASETLRFTPLLADRPVVVRPDSPVYVPSAQRTVLYVTTAAWVEISSVSNSMTPMLQLPVYRPSDTWFGKNTRRGELCYASMTNALGDYKQLALVSHRAITAVEIVNRGKDPLLIEQLRVPVPALSLYVADDGRLWTDGVHFEREEDESVATLEILATHEHTPAAKELLAKPRKPVERHSIVHAFSRLFG